MAGSVIVVCPSCLWVAAVEHDDLPEAKCLCGVAYMVDQLEAGLALFDIDRYGIPGHSWASEEDVPRKPKEVERVYTSTPRETEML